MRVVMADAGVAFDGLTPLERPLGGAESAFVALAEALSAQGAQVFAFARDARRMTHHGVIWGPVESDLASAQGADLLIINRDPALLARAPRTERTVFWLHNPAGFLTKPRYLGPLITRRPTLVTAGPHHVASIPAPVRALFPCAQIPLGVEAVFLETPRQPGPPRPRAIFTSNPLRGLDRLLTLWANAILPQTPGAELHVFSGAAVYSATGEKAEAMGEVIAAAQAAPGVVVRDPVPKSVLARELAQARTLLYLGDPGETFCLAVAEAQAMGVPAIVRPVGAVGERVRHLETGAIAGSEAEFCSQAAAVLNDDRLWSRWSDTALAHRQKASWAHAAASFAALGARNS